MLENECFFLDIKLSVEVGGCNDEEEYNKVIEAFKKLKQLEESLVDSEEKLVLINEAIVINITKTPEDEDKIKSIYQPRIDYMTTTINKKVV